MLPFLAVEIPKKRRTCDQEAASDRTQKLPPNQWNGSDMHLPSNQMARWYNFPFGPNKGRTKRVQTNVIIATLVIKCGLEMTSINIVGEIRDVVQRKWTVFNPTIQEPLIVAHAWFGWLHRNGHNQMRGSTLPTSPQTRSKPFATLSKMVCITKSQKL